MRRIALFAVLTVFSLATLAPAQQQLARFNVGDAVDYYSFGKWLPCTVAAPFTAGVYSLHCGSIDLRAKADPEQLRTHIVAVDLAARNPARADIPVPPLPLSLGARYGTREPRTCDRRKPALATDDAKELLICDAEREFGGNLFLVSNVSVDLVKPRPLTPNEMAGVPGIDRSQPVYDFHASYDKYQCTPVPRDRDNPNAHNCNQYKVTSVPGGCYKTTAGDWHCVTFNADTTTAAIAKDVKPPTLSD
jgi:hypothetical protein